MTILVLTKMGNFSTARSVTFLDIETTHLSPERSAILQICIITDKEGGGQDVWKTKIKPREIELEFASKEALRVCNYSPEKWEDAPRFEDVAQEIADRLAWGPIVAHNVTFDISHIVAAFKRRGWKELGRNESYYDVEKKYKIGYPQIDTCALAYLFSVSERQNLNALREAYDISTEGAHEAQKDAEDCRTIFYEIVSSAAGNMSK